MYPSLEIIFCAPDYTAENGLPALGDLSTVDGFLIAFPALSDLGAIDRVLIALEGFAVRNETGCS